MNCCSLSHACCSRDGRLCGTKISMFMAELSDLAPCRLEALTTSNRAFRSCCTWTDKATQKESKYLRVLVERKLANAPCSRGGPCRRLDSTAGSLSDVDARPVECLWNGPPPESRSRRGVSVGMGNQPRRTHALTFDPSIAASSTPYSDTPMSWPARAGHGLSHASYNMPHCSQESFLGPGSVQQRTRCDPPSNAVRAPNKTNATPHRPTYAQYGNFLGGPRPRPNVAAHVANPSTGGWEKTNEFWTSARPLPELPPNE
jgi:hypothetical protein